MIEPPIRPPKPTPNWATMTLAQLCDALEEHYHQPLSKELQRLEGLINAIAADEGGQPAEFEQISLTYFSLQAELEAHLIKEEQVLFEMIRSMGMAPPPPVQVMTHEHRSAEDALRTLRRLSGGYRAQDGASEEVKALFEGIEALEVDLEAHIRVEEDLLFPGALNG